MSSVAASFDAAAATNQVGLDLFLRLAREQPDLNLAISPYSIESAMALIYPGADGITRDELARALHFPANDASLLSEFSALRDALNQCADRANSIMARNQSGDHVPIQPDDASATVSDGPARVFEWHAANRLFAQNGYDLRKPYLDLMHDGFGAPLEQLEFRTAAERARGTINRWVEDQTHERIRDLIPRGGVNRDTRLVLVNALYLKAPWENSFEKKFTTPRPFNSRGAGVHDTPTMRRTASMAYAKESGLTVVALPYLVGELQFLIILPDSGQTPEATAASLTVQHFARWSHLDDGTSRQLVALYLPKFRIEGATISLGRILRDLGIESAFDEPKGSANFDRLFPRKPDDYLAISEVFHQTFVALDEDGTEAAAATAVMAVAGMAMRAPQVPIEVHVDRPFLFAIQHRASGACLFLGRVTDPR